MGGISLSELPWPAWGVSMGAVDHSHRYDRITTMPKQLLTLCGVIFCSSLLLAQGYSPEEAVKKMQLAPGFHARVVAHEPMIRQPLSISFDDRGRMWVLQYLQYPNPAGLKALKQDQYLRTVWDRVPEPPPHGPKGLDRITILSDPDERGVFQKSKDFITGLNIASGFCLGHGGVYVLQSPYLLFYPDRNQDDVPDSDPKVLLTGFGMDDTHSVANSLQWGPDGWLYGAAGSTSTSRIKNPAGKPEDPAIEFQQGIWRYHPSTRRFELFSEGGGNTFGLDFDKNGQVIAGTNWGGYGMLHQFQGAYYVKGFAKHGPLHNPHTYGYFQHVPYKDFKGGHVTCGGIVYQGDAYPTEMNDQYIAGNLLSNAIYWHRMTPVGSSYTNSHGGDLMLANDTWFRPVDVLQGPDAAVYVVDWYDKRAAHLDPIDNWDKTNGRVYRIDYENGRPYPQVNLQKATSTELVGDLSHPNVWWRREARRLLEERKDASQYPQLKSLITGTNQQTALEALWALYVSGGTDEGYLNALLAHDNPHIRGWAIRFLGDASHVSPQTLEAWTELARRERDPLVRAQLACSVRRIEPLQTLQVMAALLATADDPTDAYFPLLAWWAVEGTVARHPQEAARLFLHVPAQRTPTYEFVAERLARRLLAEDVPGGTDLAAGLITAWAKHKAEDIILKGIAEGYTAENQQATAPLRDAISALPNRAKHRQILARLGDATALAEYEAQARNTQLTEPQRLQALQVLVPLKPNNLKDVLLTLWEQAKGDALQMAVISGLAGFDDPALGKLMLERYTKASGPVKKRIIEALGSRPQWAMQLFESVDRGAIPAAEVSVEQVRVAQEHENTALKTLLEKHYGKVGPATPGEKQARISWLRLAMSRNAKGEAPRGKAIFVEHCAKCHKLFGEGNAIGPDLTTSDRKNRDYMLIHIVDPSALVRPEYVVHSADLLDGRKLSGIVVESSAQSVTLLDAENRRTVIPQADIEDIKPLPTSLMPDKLLDTLTDQQVGDLFAYLASDPPGGKAPEKSDKK